MSALVQLRSLCVVGLVVSLATGCSDQITEPTRLQPDAEIQAGRAVSRTVVALEPLQGGWSYSAAYAINDLGQAVGLSDSNSGIRAVIWDNSTVPQDLGVLTGHISSVATGISNDGRVIAGNSRDASQEYAVRWLNSNGQWLIDFLPAGAGCSVSAISSDGAAIVGTCGASAVVWLNGSRIQLGQGIATGVNARGQAVGVNSTFDHALLWTFSAQSVTETDLGTLGGTYAVANKINDAGEVTGWSENANQVSHAFLWSPRKGTMVDLSPTSGTSGGYGINATGKVVGDIFPSTQHAAYFDGRKVLDLGVLAGFSSSLAHSLNNNGKAVGWSSSNFQTRATMWILK